MQAELEISQLHNPNRCRPGQDLGLLNFKLTYLKVKKNTLFSYVSPEVNSTLEDVQKDLGGNQRKTLCQVFEIEPVSKIQKGVVCGWCGSETFSPFICSLVCVVLEKT